MPPMPKNANPDEMKAYNKLKLSTRNKITYRMWHEADEEMRQAVFAHKEQLDRDVGFVSEVDAGMEGHEGMSATNTADQISHAEMQK